MVRFFRCDPKILPALAGSLMFVAALALALFFHGPQTPRLAGAQLFLLGWLVISGATLYRTGLRIPLTPLLVAITLFWGWLGLSVAWSRAPELSIQSFWWVGSFALVFWIYTLSPERERIWSITSNLLPAVAALLALAALYQSVLLQQKPVASFHYTHAFGAFMTLLAFPLAGRFLLSLGRPVRSTPWIMGSVLFLTFLAIALTHGRGATFCLVAGLALFGLMTIRLIPVKGIWLIVGMLISAYLLADGISQGALSERLMTLSDPASAGSDRFRLWGASWELLKEAPWLGTGLGTYYLAWPPYRDPSESSAGFFAHNDYLQIWIETGLPGLLLFLAVLFSVLWMLIRYRGQPGVARESRVETAVLFTGLLAIAMHSFADFDFYVMPTSMVAGLLLGRFHELTSRPLAMTYITGAPRRYFGRHAYMTSFVLLVLFPATYLGALLLSEHYYKQGVALAKQGRLVEASETLSYAEHLVPLSDKVLIAHADLLRQALFKLPASAVEERKALYDDALALFRRLERANAYRAIAYSLRGRLYHANPDLAGDGWALLAEHNYRQALDLNPRFFKTRMLYAELLRQNGKSEDARKLLEEGIQYWYYAAAELMPFYEMTLNFQRRTGKKAGVAHTRRLIEKLKADLAAPYDQFGNRRRPVTLPEQTSPS